MLQLLQCHADDARIHKGFTSSYIIRFQSLCDVINEFASSFVSRGVDGLVNNHVFTVES